MCRGGSFTCRFCGSLLLRLESNHSAATDGNLPPISGVIWSRYDASHRRKNFVLEAEAEAAEAETELEAESNA